MSCKKEKQCVLHKGETRSVSQTVEKQEVCPGQKINRKCMLKKGKQEMCLSLENNRKHLGTREKQEVSSEEKRNRKYVRHMERTQHVLHRAVTGSVECTAE